MDVPRTVPALVVLGLVLAIATPSFAQAPPLVFTVGVPSHATSGGDAQVYTAIEERGLGLLQGHSADLGVGVDARAGRFVVRTTTSLTALPGSGWPYSTFEQVELVLPVIDRARLGVGAGAGLRREIDGTQVLVMRGMARTTLAGGSLQGNVVVERAFDSPARRDAIDVVTTVGWSHRSHGVLALGVEAIGRDLEGFWNPLEAEGGATLLVGPTASLHPRTGQWSLSVTGGPLLHSRSALSSVPETRGHYGVFASFSLHPWR